MKLKHLIAVPALLAAAAFAAPASALTIEATVGATTQSCVDNEACDSNPAAGVVNWNVTGFAAWLVNVQVGVSNAPGTPGGAELHLTSTLSATSASTMTLKIFDSFTMPTGPGELEIAGTGGDGDNVTASIYGYKLDAEENYYVTDSCSPELFQNGQGCSASTTHPELVGPYEMGLIATVTSTGNTGAFSLDLDVTNVPEPTSIALLGLGLLGLGATTRRRRV